MAAIVIVNWNSGAHLKQCLASLATGAHEHDIVVLDNASEDGSWEEALPVMPHAVFIRNERNAGFAAACNSGWRRSRGEAVLFLNPDTEAQPGAVSRLQEALEGHPDAWACGGQLTDETGRPQIGFNVRSFPTLGSVAAEMLLLDSVWRRNPWTRRYLMLDWDHRSFRFIDQPAGACLMVKRRVLESLGGFDENFYPAWFEDVDLCRRIHAAGGRIAYEPAARFVHHGGSSLRRLPPEQFLVVFHTNQCRYFSRHHGAAAARRVRRLAVAGMGLRAAFSLIRPAAGLSRIRAARLYAGVARALSRMPAEAP